MMDKRQCLSSKFLTVCFLVCQLLYIVSCMKDCEIESLTNNQGYISSPNYPYNYNFDYCKYWFIRGPEGSTISVSAPEGYVNIYSDNSEDSDCNNAKDYLRLGPVPVKIYCKHQHFYTYYTQLSHVWIKFMASSRFTATGFHLRYQIFAPLTTTPEPTLPMERKCKIQELECRVKSSYLIVCLSSKRLCDGVEDCVGGEDEHSTLCHFNDGHCHQYFHQNSGVIHSPRYPKHYPSSVSCSYQIQSTVPESTIQLRFHDFQLQEKKNTDYLVIYDGRSRISPILGVYSGLSPPPYTVQSNTEWLFIRFHTDSSITSTGFNLTYQTTGVCLADQFRCTDNERNCYDKHQKCNGVWDCKQHGRDELGCDHCGPEEFSCGPGDYKCYKEDVRCDGKGFCADYSDEKNCTNDRCNTRHGLFLCNNGRCIYEKWICDNSNDCGDGSDETDCSGSPTRVIIAAVVGSLVCSLLLVVTLGCTCRLYVFRTRDSCRQRHSTPLSRLQIEIMGRRPPPPSYNEAMLTSRPYEEVRQEIMSRVSTSGEINMANRPLPVPPYEESSDGRADNNMDESRTQLIPESASDSDTSGCDNPNFQSDDDELLDLTEDSNVHIRMSQDLAAWNSNTSLNNDESGDTQLLDFSDKSTSNCDKNSKSSAKSTSDPLVDVSAPSDSPSCSTSDLDTHITQQTSESSCDNDSKTAEVTPEESSTSERATQEKLSTSEGVTPVESRTSVESPSSLEMPTLNSLDTVPLTDMN